MHYLFGYIYKIFNVISFKIEIIKHLRCHFTFVIRKRFMFYLITYYGFVFFRRCKCNSHGLACNELNGLNCLCVDNTVSCDPSSADCRNEQVIQTNSIIRKCVFTSSLQLYNNIMSEM